MSEPGPLAQALEEEVLGELRRRRVVFWIDEEGACTRFVQALAARRHEGEEGDGGDRPVVVVFNGSLREVLLALAPYESGFERPQLLVHAANVNEDWVRRTPLVELYETGTRFQKEVPTLVREVAQGRVAPDLVQQYLESGKRPTLDEADAWMSQQIASTRQGLWGLLELVGATVVLDGLNGKNAIFSSLPFDEARLEILRAFLLDKTGMDSAWLEFYGQEPRADAFTRLTGAFAGWLLAVELVHTLPRPPEMEALLPLRGLAPTLVTTCRELVHHLRSTQPGTYALVADETERRIRRELAAARPEDFGQVVTFRGQETRILEGAMEALRARDWSRAQGLVAMRDPKSSFWLRNPFDRATWALVSKAAALGDAILRCPRPLEAVRGHAEALERYTQTAFRIDLLHRRFEQEWLTHRDTRMDRFGELRVNISALRQLYREWVDALAKDYTSLCREHGFLPETALQQRTLYDDVVHPLVSGPDKVAYFLVDGLRYEMATELAEELRKLGAAVQLHARFAELPTITSFGMNALAPVVRDGRLCLARDWDGFRAGKFRVRRPQDRARAMGDRSTGRPALLLDLAKVCDAELPALARRIAQEKLIVVHSQEIDKGGEVNLGLATFPLSLQTIAAAAYHLRQVGVRRFVFTADHGFLLRDETTAVQRYGTKREPNRRYVLTDGPRAEAGMVSVSLAQLGYDGDGAERHLLLPEDTTVFATGTTGDTFVHGGNSLQERVIPVLTVTMESAQRPSAVEYAIHAEPLPDVHRLRRARVRVVLAAGSEGSVAAARVTLRLRASGRPEVLVLIKEVNGPGALRGGQLEVPVGDAWTELLFQLEGPRDERVRLEFFHGDCMERVASSTPEDWFDVYGTAELAARARTARPPSFPAGWQNAFADPGVRAVFAHLAEHDDITQREATRLLGSPWAYREFIVELDTHVRRSPFGVVMETSPDGQIRLVREDKQHLREDEK
jgi:hypothetical protein